MDQGTNVSLSTGLLNSRENTQLYSKQLPRPLHSEKITTTNLRSQFRKKYGNKHKEESVYRDLSKIEKQVTLLSACVEKDEHIKKMLPECTDNSNSNQKINLSEHGNHCHTITTKDSIEQVKYDMNINSSQNILALSQDQLFLSNKSYPQFNQKSTKMPFNLNTYLDDKNNSADTGFMRPFAELSPNKINNDIITYENSHETGENDLDDDDDDDDDDEDDRNDYSSKLRKNQKNNYAAFDFDGDSSGLFEFSLEGEKLVSSLCGPQSKGGRNEDGIQNLIVNKSNQELSYPETFKGITLEKSCNTFLSKHADIGMSFSNAVTSTPEKENSNSIHEFQIHHESKLTNKSQEEDKGVVQTEHSISKYSTDEMKVESDTSDKVISKLSNAKRIEKSPLISVEASIFGNIKQTSGLEITSKNGIDLNTLQGSMTREKTEDNIRKSAESPRSEDINKSNKSASVPNIFSMLNKFNQGNTFSIASNTETPIQSEAEVKNGGTVPDNCDDEISFRKSAIKGCLVFERIIKDLHTATFQDLENYCKTVKRCVSVANSIESKEYTVLISELISSFLKLADSWGILNSYFGESGNNDGKSQSLDDINLYQSFQDWQIKSKSLLDNMTIVVQNLKESLPKHIEKEIKITKDSQTTKFSQYNPFFNQFQPKSSIINATTNKSGNTSFPLTQSVQKEDNINYQISLPFQTQEIQFPKNIANIFSTHNQNNNWKTNISDSSKKKSPEIYWEFPTPNNHHNNVFNLQTLSERKQRKKWTLTMPEIQNETSCSVVPGQGITMQQQAAGPLPAINFQYVTQNKSPVENIMMQPINFFGNQFSNVPQNMQNIQNMRENTTAAYNYCRPQTLYSNLKQSPKRKSNINFKPEEQFHKDVINSNAMYNRVNICNPQMNIPLLQNNGPPNPFGIIDESKNNVIYQNFCIGETKPLANNTSYGTPFIQNEIYPTNPVPNQNMFCLKNCEPKPMMPVPLSNCDGDDSSEEYYPMKSYMKPGSYRVPNKSKSLLQTTNNLNYIFDDVLVTGITVPFTKSNIFSQSKKNAPKTVNTNEKSIQTNRSDDIRNTDLVWKAALASAEELGKSLICKQDEKNQTDIISTSQDKDALRTQEHILEESNRLSEETQSFDSSINISTHGCNQNKDEIKKTESEVTKHSAVKTDDWLIQSLSKLETLPDAKDNQSENFQKSENENSSIKSGDSKSKISNTKSNESDESDITANELDSECCSKDKGVSQKKEKYNGTKQKVSPNLRSVSILQKPREYCQSRPKLWEKTRDFSYQIPPYKGDSRNLHKNPASWIKYNRKCINRQTLFKLQDILNNLSKMETSSGEMHKGTVSHENINKIININAVNYKLKSHIYENVDQILIDIRQMFINGRESNKECSNNIEMINKLEILFDELVEKHFGQSDSADNRENINHNGSSLAIKNRRMHKVQRKLN